MSTHDPEKLEAAIHRALRSVPDRKAPAGLQARVFAELNRRAALPWWRKSYAYWPAAIRAAFFIGTALAAALVVSGLIALLRNTGASQDLAGVEQRFAWLGVVRDNVASTRAGVQHVIALIPPLWLYGAIGTVILCYVSLAAIGAATYRAIMFERQNG